MPKSKTVKKIKAMKMKKILCLFLLPAMLACGKGGDVVVDDTPRKYVETTGRQMRAADDGAEAPLPPPDAITAYTLDNLPVIDGSDSTQPLRTLLTCRLIGKDCWWDYNATMPFSRWIMMYYDPAAIEIYGRAEQEAYLDSIWRLNDKLLNNNTNASFLNLIRGEKDVCLIVTARGISRDEQQEATERGVELLSRPVARDAFVFIVNRNNPVHNLTIEQMKKIYMGEITNWKEVGGNDAPIHPYIRNANSGSQEKMETVVMAGLDMPSWNTMILSGMSAPYSRLGHDIDGICYTPYYYYKFIARDEKILAISLDGIEPNRTTIADGTYPYVTEVMASVRSDVDRSSTAYQLFYELATGRHDAIITESGYIPMPDNNASGITPVMADSR